jgi:hypothetical protein
MTTHTSDHELNDVHRRIRNILNVYPAGTWTLDEWKIVLAALAEIVRGRPHPFRDVVAEADAIKSQGLEAIPDDPEAAALDLIVCSTEVLADPVVSAGVQEFAVLLEVEGAFTGMSWPDARRAATVIAFDAVLLVSKAVESLRRRATEALAGDDGEPWEDREAVARALNIAAKVLEASTDGD